LRPRYPSLEAEAAADDDAPTLDFFASLVAVTIAARSIISARS